MVALEGIDLETLPESDFLDPFGQGTVDIELDPDQELAAPDGLIVDDFEVLRGSGEVDGTVVNEGLVSPGYSPGIQTYDSLV